MSEVVDNSQWQEIADYIRDELRNELAAQDHNATGALSQGVKVNVEVTNEHALFKGTAADYGIFVNNGRRAGAGRPPTSAIYSWMVARGIGNDLQKEYQRRGLAYVIARSISERGIPPQGGYSSHYARGNSIQRTGWVDKTLERIGEPLMQKIKEIIKASFEVITRNFYRKDTVK